jgi:ketosteroid isomerase-like protein
MSQEDVEVVRAFLQAPDLNGIMAALDTAIEWTPIDSDPAFAIHRGHDDVRAWLAEWQEAFPDLRFEAERVIDGRGRIVVALGRLAGRGETSGLDVGSPVYGIVFTVRSGKIVRAEEMEREKAVEVVGVPE